MKLILFFVMLIVFGNLRGQQGSSNNSEGIVLAQKIAKKMKDSLDLSAQQRQQIYQVNMNLDDQKQSARLSSPQDSLEVRIQRIEKTRDSLYMSILGNVKHQLYLQKKKNLVNNN